MKPGDLVRIPDKGSQVYIVLRRSSFRDFSSDDSKFADWLIIDPRTGTKLTTVARRLELVSGTK